jgi:hypothetical protein
MNFMELDALIYEVIVDANGEDEQLWAFRQARPRTIAAGAAGTWDPKGECWGEEGDVLDDRTKAVIACGPRRSFEMEQLLPVDDPDDPDGDPIIRSNDLESAGDYEAACQILMELCESDLRCLDAHAHLGSLIFDHIPGDAMRHYEVGLRIGELSPDSLADGLLSWGGSTTARSCAACTASGCACGDWNGSRRPGVFLTACCGSTRRTIRASASILPRSGREGVGKRTNEGTLPVCADMHSLPMRVPGTSHSSIRNHWRPVG